MTSGTSLQITFTSMAFLDTRIDIGSFLKVNYCIFIFTRKRIVLFCLFFSWFSFVPLFIHCELKQG